MISPLIFSPIYRKAGGGFKKVLNRHFLQFTHSPPTLRLSR
nr:MAG TPA: hypothetical protein [Caudoviricetes sp.]